MAWSENLKRQRLRERRIEEEAEKKRKAEKRKLKFTYLMYDGNYYKIGESVNPKERLNSLKTANPSVKLLCYSKNVSEKEMHKLFKPYRYLGEWFMFDSIQANRIISLIETGKDNVDSINFLKELKEKEELKKKEDFDNLINSYKISFGKHHGRLIIDMVNDYRDIEYCQWYYYNCLNNYEGTMKLKDNYLAFKWVDDKYRGRIQSLKKQHELLRKYFSGEEISKINDYQKKILFLIYESENNILTQKERQSVYAIQSIIKSKALEELILNRDSIKYVYDFV